MGGFVRRRAVQQAPHVLQRPAQRRGSLGIGAHQGSRLVQHPPDPLQLAQPGQIADVRDQRRARDRCPAPVVPGQRDGGVRAVGDRRGIEDAGGIQAQSREIERDLARRCFITGRPAIPGGGPRVLSRPSGLCLRLEGCCIRCFAATPGDPCTNGSDTVYMAHGSSSPLAPSRALLAGCARQSSASIAAGSAPSSVR